MTRPFREAMLERALAGLLFRITRGGWPSGNPYLQGDVRNGLEVLAHVRDIPLPKYGTPEVLTCDDAPPGMFINADGCWEVCKR